MKRYFALALILSLVVVEAAAQLSGRVFWDRNSNGVFDPTDRPMPSVGISDGLNVVKTDRNGQFTLSGHDGQKFVFITTPSGYAVSAKHYLPIADGATYDFALIPTEGRVARDGSHSFLQVTDTEISSAEGHERLVDGMRAYAADQKSAFIIHTGDICYEKGLNAHIGLMNDRNMGLPVRYCIGNHDYVAGAYGEELFESLYGPIYYSFDVGNTHYVVTPMSYGDRQPGFSPDMVAKWLANDLSAMRKGMSLVVFNHDLPFRDGRFVYGKDQHAVDLTKHNLTGWIYGHWHINHVKNYGAVTTICSSADKGGIDHSAATFRRIDLNKQGVVSSQLIYPYVDHSLAIAHCGANGGGGDVSVNCYNTSSPAVGMTAHYTIAGKPATRKLTPTTDWNWRATLPSGASLNSVEATFDNKEVRSVEWRAAAYSLFATKWSANVGSNIYLSSPVLSGDRVMVGCVDEAGSGKAGVACFDAKSGAKLWFFATRNSVKNAIAATANRVFAQDAEGYLYAIDVASGGLCWEQKLGVADPLPSVVEGLAIHGDRLYAGTGKGLTAMDFDGRVVWQNGDWSQNEGTVSLPAFTDSMILMGSQWQALFANDLATGKMVWRADKDGLRFRASTPVFARGVIYVLSQNSLFLLNPRNGEVIVRHKLPYNVEVASRPLLTDDAIIFGTTDGGIQALNIETLEPKWNVATGAGLIYTAPYYRYAVNNIESSAALTAGGNVIIGAADGVVRVINAATGEVLHQVSLGAPVLTTFAVDANACYVADYAGNVYRFDTAL